MPEEHGSLKHCRCYRGAARGKVLAGTFRGKTGIKVSHILDQEEKFQYLLFYYKIQTNQFFVFSFISRE